MGDAFAGVVWVPAPEFRAIDHIVLRKRNDLTRIERHGTLEIACVPFMDDATDLGWTVEERLDARFYRIAPDPSLKARVAAVLELLDLCGATIGVLPELALSEAILAAWLEAIRERPGTRREQP